MRVVLATTLLLLAGCGGGGGGSEVPPFGSCTVFRQGSNVSVEFAGPAADSFCDAVMQKWSSEFAFWSREPNYGGSTVVCELHQAEVLARVWDGGGLDFGREACGLLASRGWR